MSGEPEDTSASLPEPMKIGLYVPTSTGSFEGIPSGSDMIRYAQCAEEIGFDSLWVPDLFRYQFSDGEEAELWECWSVLAALAASTKQILLGSLVTCNVYRHPTLLAKIAATVDEISGGRLILGVGSGDPAINYSSHGYLADHLYGRFEESLAILSSLLRTGYADFTGTYYQVHDCVLQLRGPRPTGIPLLIGAETPGPRMLRLIARYADMWNHIVVYLSNNPQETIPMNKTLDEVCKEVQRAPETLERTTSIYVNMTGRRIVPGLWEPTSDEQKFSPEQLVQTFLEFEQTGTSHLQIILMPETFASLEAFAPVLALLKKERINLVKKSA